MALISKNIIPQFIPYWDDAEKKAVQKVLDGDMILEHKLTREFERRFAEFVKARYCITCTSGSVALYLALMAKYYVYKRILIVPPHQGIYVSNAVTMAGHTPIIEDVSKNGSLKIKDKQEDVFTVHANGRLGLTNGLEDCAQAITHHTKNILSCYSFASSKHMTTDTGQGGAVCCDDKEIYNLLSALKDHGRTDRQNLKAMSDDFTSRGFNFKFGETQSAFAMVQLKKLPKRLHRLNKLYEIVEDELDGDKILVLPEIPSWYIDIFVEDPNKVINHLKKFGIVAKRTMKPLYLQKICMNQMSGYFPESKYFYEHCVYLPSTTNLIDEQMYTICEKVKEAIK